MKQTIKKQFPIFKNQPNLIYLDNAATTQICAPSLNALTDYYLKYRANVHRGVYNIAEKATTAFENARISAAKFLNSEQNEIIFTSGSTAGLNFLASSLTPRLSHRENVVITKLEHHSNLVPWQQAAKHYGFELRFIDVTSDFRIDLESAKKLIDQNTKIVSFAMVSNVLGSIAPAREIISLAKNVKALTIVDAAQAAAHLPIDVKKLNCDFLVLSGHKVYGPNGIGILYGKKELLSESVEPISFGGEMVSEVTVAGATWATVPHRFEAGTPNIAGAIGLGAALEFIGKIGWKKIANHEKNLTKYALQKLSPLVKIFGPSLPTERAGVIAFTIPGIHPHDIADIINTKKIAARAGLHCAEPLHREFRLPGSVRISLGIYNNEKDIDALVSALKTAKKIFKV
ncbi:MAG: SufS family cysteine desulfurase [Patescibacteria group bacterium]|jgi:cysteine desulfurase/selenocysteine lyase